MDEVKVKAAFVGSRADVNLQCACWRLMQVRSLSGPACKGPAVKRVSTGTDRMGRLPQRRYPRARGCNVPYREPVRCREVVKALNALQPTSLSPGWTPRTPASAPLFLRFPSSPHKRQEWHHDTWAFARAGSTSRAGRVQARFHVASPLIYRAPAGPSAACRDCSIAWPGSEAIFRGLIFVFDMSFWNIFPSSVATSSLTAWCRDEPWQRGGRELSRKKILW
jgi:hypothetical protein